MTQDANDYHFCSVPRSLSASGAIQTMANKMFIHFHCSDRIIEDTTRYCSGFKIVRCDPEFFKLPYLCSLT